MGLMMKFIIDDFLSHITPHFQRWARGRFADVPLKVFVSFASLEILVADNTENLVLDYGCAP